MLITIIVTLGLVVLLLWMFHLKMLLTIIVTLGLAVLLLWLLARPFYWAGKGIKYLTPMPIVGNFGPIFEGFVTLSDTLYKKFPDEKLYGIHVFLDRGLVIRDPHLIVDIGIKDYEHFSDNGLGANQEYDLTGGNLLFLHGQQWREVRSKVSPFFTPMKIKSMLNSVDVTIPKTMKVLDEAIRVGEPCNQTEILIQIVNDVITQAVFGVESDVYEKDSKFKPLASIFFSQKTNMMFMVKHTSKRLFKFLRLQSFDYDASLFLKRIVRDLVDYRNKNNVHGNDFVQGMMDIMEKHGKNSDGPVEYYPDGTKVPKFNFDEMFLHAFIIFLAGVESTGSTMTWLFNELAKNQEIQERCREEVLSVVARKGRHVTLDDVNELPYITAAIKEAVRMYPPFMMMSRICTKTYTFKEPKVTLYPGNFIIYPSTSVQRDPNYFPDPDTFNPDRFMGEDPPTGYITTFGIGPKMCLGKAFANYEMLLVVSRLLQKYRFKMSAKTQVPLVPDRFRPINAPSTTLWLDVTNV